MAKKPTTRVTKSVTWAQSFRDIFLRLFSSHKYIPTLAAIITLYALHKADSADVPKILETVTAKSSVISFAGWFVAVVVTVASVLTLRFMRTTYLSQIDRLSAERTKLQEILSGRELEKSTFKGGKS